MERNEIIKTVDNILRNAEATYSGKLELIADYVESLINKSEEDAL